MLVRSSINFVTGSWVAVEGFRVRPGNSSYQIMSVSRLKLSAQEQDSSHTWRAGIRWQDWSTDNTRPHPPDETELARINALPFVLCQGSVFLPQASQGLVLASTVPYSPVSVTVRLREYAENYRKCNCFLLASEESH